MIAKENGQVEMANLILQLAPKSGSSHSPDQDTDSNLESSPEGLESPEKVSDGNTGDGKSDHSGHEKLSTGPVAINMKASSPVFGRHLYTLLLVLILITATRLARLD